MVLTPTYYVFKMYVPHQDAQLIPAQVACPVKKARDGRDVPVVSATASAKNGVTTLSLVNTDLKEDVTITVMLNGIPSKKISGEILTAANMNDYNDFGQPEKVSTKPFSSKSWKASADRLTVTLPAKSIVTLSLSM